MQLIARAILAGVICTIAVEMSGIVSDWPADNYILLGLFVTVFCWLGWMAWPSDKPEPKGDKQ